MRKRDIHRKANDILLHTHEVEEMINSSDISGGEQTLRIIACELSSIKEIATEIRDE